MFMFVFMFSELIQSDVPWCRLTMTVNEINILLFAIVQSLNINSIEPKWQLLPKFLDLITFFIHTGNQSIK